MAVTDEEWPSSLFAKHTPRTGARRGTSGSIQSYFGTRHDDRTRHHLCGKSDPLLQERLMESFREKNGGLSSNRLIGEQVGAEILTRTCDLEPHDNCEEKETLTATAGLSDEIKRAHPEFDTTEILPESKETARPIRRRKIRVYLP